ncbi:MAG: c-type cytochrome [Betaproteobacteria bacterium]
MKELTMKQTCLLVLGAALAGMTNVAGAQTNPADVQKAAEEKVVNLCSTCHGPRGISTSSEFPILAAQRKGYLEAQIDAFRKRTRAEKDAHDFMWGIAGNLDEAIVGGIASYYSAQPPAAGRSEDAALVAKGKELFDKGVLDRGIPACATCHGANGEGVADFPRLAGQHAKYVAKQLTYIQSLVRAAPVMHGIIKDLTPAEIAAVATYVQSR